MRTLQQIPLVPSRRQHELAFYMRYVNYLDALGNLSVWSLLLVHYHTQMIWRVCTIDDPGEPFHMLYANGVGSTRVRFD